MAEEANEIIQGDRNDSYGDPRINLGRIALFWSAYVGVNITASDVAKMMTLVKISRTKHTYVRDNYLDGVAYLLLAEELEHAHTD